MTILRWFRVDSEASWDETFIVIIGLTVVGTLAAPLIFACWLLLALNKVEMLLRESCGVGWSNERARRDLAMLPPFTHEEVTFDEDIHSRNGQMVECKA